MSEEVIRIELGGSGGNAKSLQDLKKEYRDLQTELSKTKVGSDEYIQTLKKLGAVKDDIGDLRDTISALNPEGKVAAFAKVGSTIASGFAAAQGAAALFGAESEELQKTMLKVQAAMALTEGIKGIAQAGDAFKVLNAVMKANPIAAIVAGFTALATTVAVLYNNYKDANSESAKLESNHQKLKASTDSLVKSIDSEILALKGLKSNDEEILALTEKKLKANIELERSSLRVALAKHAEQEAEFNYNEQALRLIGKTEEADKLRYIRTEESRNAALAAGQALKESIAGLSNFQNEQQQKDLDNYKQHLKGKEEALKAHDEELYQQHLREVERFEQARRDEADKKKITDKEDADALALSVLEAEAEYQNDSYVQEQKANSDKEFAEQQSLERRKEGYKQLQNSQLDLTKQTLQATQALTDLYFGHQLKMAKGNAAKETEIRKKQFNVNKAFGVANSIIDGVGAIQKALNNPYPLNIILAVLTGVLATANTIKIATSKFDEGGGASGGAGDIGSVGTPSVPVVPQPNNTVTKISDDGKVENKQPVVKAIVVESDMTDKQKRINTIQETAKFG